MNISYRQYIIYLHELYTNNMKLLLQKSKKFLMAVLFCAGFLNIFVFIPLHLVQMASMHEMHHMQHCPFESSTEVVCTTPVINHISEYVSWFGFYVALFLFIAASALVFFETQKQSLKFYLYPYSSHPGVICYLTLLYSRGILNTRAY